MTHLQESANADVDESGSPFGDHAAEHESASGTQPRPDVDSAPLTWVTRLLAENNAWKPVAVRGASIAAAMVGLALIGVLSAQPKSPGRVEPAEPQLASQITTSWLAGGPAPGVTPSSAGSKPLQAAPDTELPKQSGAEEKPATPPAQAAQSGVTSDGKVILNRANASELTLLPGVGKKRAEKIVALRTKLKRFKRATDLLRIRGIGIKSLRKMLPHLVLDPPTAEASGGQTSSVE